MSQSFKWVMEGAAGESRVRLLCDLCVCSGCGFGVFRGTWSSIRSGAGCDSHLSFSSSCEELGGSHQQFTDTQRFLHFRDG